MRWNALSLTRSYSRRRRRTYDRNGNVLQQTSFVVHPTAL